MARCVQRSKAYGTERTAAAAAAATANEIETGLRYVSVSFRPPFFLPPPSRRPPPPPPPLQSIMLVPLLRLRAWLNFLLRVQDRD